jgi:hypothetical protein
MRVVFKDLDEVFLALCLEGIGLSFYHHAIDNFCIARSGFTLLATYFHNAKLTPGERFKVIAVDMLASAVDTTLCGPHLMR